MNDILRFGYVELKELNKTVVYIKEHNLSKVYEEWIYNNTVFSVKKYKETNYGDIEIKRRKDGSIYKFSLFIGKETNYYVVDNDVVKIFKDLESFVYNTISLKEYLNNKDVYYFVNYSPRFNEFSIDYFKLDYDINDLNMFLSGNMFKSLKSAKRFAKRIKENKLNIFEELKKRVNREFKNIKFK